MTARGAPALSGLPGPYPGCLPDLPVPLRHAVLEPEHVIVMEIHPISAQLRQLAHRPVRRHRRTHRPAEHIHPLPPHRPDTERELILPGRHVRVRAHQPLLSVAKTFVTSTSVIFPRPAYPSPRRPSPTWPGGARRAAGGPPARQARCTPPPGGAAIP